MSDHEIRTSALLQSLERQRNEFANQVAQRDAIIATLQHQLSDANRKVATLQAEVEKPKPAEVAA